MSTQETLISSQNYFFEAAGNTFFIQYKHVLPNDEQIKKDSEQIFKKHSNFDTLLYVAKIGENQFKYLVIERDSSWSEMCGNGARAVAKFLYGGKHVEFDKEIILVTNSGKEIPVNRVEKEKQVWYNVNMGKVTNVSEDRKVFSTYLDENFDGQINPQEIIKVEFQKYLDNSDILNQIYPDRIEDNGETKDNSLSNYDTYFLTILNRINLESKDQKEFQVFLKSLDFKGLYQSGGEPHTLIEITNSNLKQEFGETKFNVFLKLTSFLLRFSKANGQKIYPLSMNFMFYEIEEENEQNRVVMYPAERGVHNGVNFDQTGACGTGSTCLGTYLLNNDTRFAGDGEIKIKNHSGVILEIKKDENNNSHLIGQAKESDLNKKLEQTPFTAQVFLENFNYYNPNGEQNLENLSQQTQGTELELFYKIRELFKTLSSGEAPAITTIDHPNPKDFFDWYTLIGYLNSAYITNELGLKLHRTSLDTTGIRGGDYPVNLAFGNLGISLFDQNQLEGWKKDSTLYSYLRDLVKSGFKDTMDLLTKIKNKNVKQSINQTKEGLLEQLEQAIAEILINSISDENLNLPVRETIFLNAFKKATADYTTKIKELLESQIISLENNKLIGLPQDTLVNLFQGFLKGRMMEIIFKLATTSEQKGTLKKANILNEKSEYNIPELQSLDEINEIYKQGTIIILEQKPNLLTRYFAFLLKKTEKSKLESIVTIEGKLVSFEVNIGFVYDKNKITEEELKNSLKNSTHTSINGVIAAGPLLALGQLHHFGSERGQREMFLAFLQETCSNEKELLEEIIYASKGLICPDYNPNDYNTSKIGTPPAFPIATDNAESGNPFLDLADFGITNIKKLFQDLVADSNKNIKKTKI